MNILNMINSEFFINIPFGEIYPMTTEIVNKLIVSLSAKIIDVNIGNVFVDGLKDDMYIIIEKEGKAIKYPKLKTIYTTLVASSITNILIIAPAFSNKCYDFAMEKEFHIMTINSFMNEEMRITYTKNLGRKAWTHDAKKNMTISVRIPVEGYPTLGYKGPLHAEDIYKIIKSKTELIKNGVSVDATKVFFKAFKSMLDLINNDKNITSNRWNEIMEEHGVLDFLSENGDKVMEVINS